MEKQRKYKIDEEIKKLNLPKYKAALKVIPEKLGIASNTFHNYRKLAITDKTDIPHEMVIKLELIFKMKRGELANYKTQCEDLDALINAYNNSGRLAH